MKTLFIDGGEEAPKIVPFERQHLYQAKKFLYWSSVSSEDEGLLIVGSRTFGIHLTLEQTVRKILEVSARKLIGAGDVAGDSISSWWSLSLNVHTPTELKAGIQAALGIR